MTTSIQGRAVHKLANVGIRPAVVVLEPWGGEYDIGPNESIDLVISGSLDARLEFELDDNRLTIISDGPELSITRHGKPVAAR